MSLRSAHTNITLLCKVLDLPQRQNLAKGPWRILVGEIAIAIAYCAKTDELHLSHQTNSPVQSAKLQSDFDVVKKFSECHLKHPIHWLEVDAKTKQIKLYLRIALADNNDVALAIEAPLFAQLCTRWRLFAPRSKSISSDFGKPPLSKVNLHLAHRHAPKTALALCGSENVLLKDS